MTLPHPEKGQDLMIVIALLLLMAGSVSLPLLNRSVRKRTVALARDYEASGGDIEVAFLREIAKAQQENRPGKRLLSRLRARRTARVLAIIRRDLGKGA
jgi:hypothetical protein